MTGTSRARVFLHNLQIRFYIALYQEDLGQDAERTAKVGLVLGLAFAVAAALYWVVYRIPLSDHTLVLISTGLGIVSALLLLDGVKRNLEAYPRAALTAATLVALIFFVTWMLTPSSGKASALVPDSLAVGAAAVLAFGVMPWVAERIGLPKAAARLHLPLGMSPVTLIAVVSLVLSGLLVARVTLVPGYGCVLRHKIC